MSSKVKGTVRQRNLSLGKGITQGDLKEVEGVPVLAV